MSRAEQLERLRRTLAELPGAVSAAAVDPDGRPGPDDWSLLEVMAHLADAELMYGLRLRLLVGGDEPALQGYDEQRWTDRFARLETLATALERWRVVREANLRLLESLSEAEWTRSGLHSERGREDVAEQLQRMADHDEGHLRQLAALG